MAMDFWDAQRRARKKTRIYLFVFMGMAVLVAVLVEIAFQLYAADVPYPTVGPLFFLVTISVAGFQYLRFRALGGAHVAESLGAAEINENTDDPKERKLLNIVQEIAIASSLPLPRVFVIEANEINAFAAGLSPKDAAIAVTKGTLEKLDRDELQGVVAHEMGHIANGDMTIGLRLAAMVMGFYFVLYMGLKIIQFSGRGRKKEGGIYLVAFLLVAAGALTWLFGSILKATVSREREYLADASSVQYTRNPEGLASALKKIQEDSQKDMPKAGMAFSHLYFSNHKRLSSLFATHPPLEMRIAAIENTKKLKR